jgi:hypothetical protein
MKTLAADGNTDSIRIEDIEKGIANTLRLYYGVETSKVPGGVISEVGRKIGGNKWPIRVDVKVDGKSQTPIPGELVTAVHWDEDGDRLAMFYEVILNMPKWAEDRALAIAKLEREEEFAKQYRRGAGMNVGAALPIGIWLR